MTQNNSPSASILTTNGRTSHGVLPQSARAGIGASMRRGILPVAYWHRGDGTARTFVGVTREHAFQRALRHRHTAGPISIRAY